MNFFNFEYKKMFLKFPSCFPKKNKERYFVVISANTSLKLRINMTNLIRLRIFFCML